MVMYVSVVICETSIYGCVCVYVYANMYVEMNECIYVWFAHIYCIYMFVWDDTIATIQCCSIEKETVRVLYELTSTRIYDCNKAQRIYGIHWACNIYIYMCVCVCVHHLVDMNRYKYGISRDIPPPKLE